MTMGGGGKLAGHLSVGVLAAAYPYEQVAAAVAAADRSSERVRALPAEAVTYYVMALGLLVAVSTREVLRVLMEGLRWLDGNAGVKVASKAAIAQARQRLGAEPLRQLWAQNARPPFRKLSSLSLTNRRPPHGRVRQWSNQVVSAKGQ